MRADDGSATTIPGWRNGISPIQYQRSIDIISPPPRLMPDQWMEEFFYLPAEENAERGKFKFSRRPHQTAMVNDPMDPAVREIFWMGASQVMGKTICLIGIECYVIDQIRKSMVVVYSTIDSAVKWKKNKFLPTVEAIPKMNGLLVEPRKRDGRSTMQNQRYPGGSMSLLGANSPSGFRGSSAPIVIQDELDAYKDNEEGDPSALADRAAKTFSDAWLIKASTPTLEGMSAIHAGYLRGDQQKYFVPCPHCGGFQHLKTEQMKFSFTPEEHSRFGAEKKSFKSIVNSHPWEIGVFPIKDTPKTIYVCEHEACKRGWTDTQRREAYLSGHKDNPAVVVNGKELRAEWRATAPFNGVRSRHINGMYLIVGLKKGFDNYLHQFAEDFLAAKRKGRAALMSWTNMFKNEPFAEVSEKLDWQPLKDRAEDIGPGLEPQAIVILGACDVQRNPPRVEIMWGAFGPLEEAWLLDWEVISGDFDLPDTQARVAEHIAAKRFTHPYLGELAPYAMAIDYGHQTKIKAVFEFCRKHRTCGATKIFPVKGFDQSLGALWEQHYDRRYYVQKYYFNVDAFKSIIFDRLGLTEPGARYIHIPKETVTYTDAAGVKQTFSTNFTTTFYTELCSERRIPKRNKDGTTKYQWVKISQSARNEPLDLMDYMFGLYVTQGLGGWIGKQWEKVKRLMREREEKLKKESPVAPASPSVNPQNVPPEQKDEPSAQPFKSGKLADTTPQRPAFTRPPRRPMVRRPQQKRPPWQRGIFNPLNI